MSKPILFFFFLLCINFSFAQTIDASLLEINFHEDSDPQKLTSYQTGFISQPPMEILLLSEENYGILKVNLIQLIK
jgi:hypothetical protein